MNINYQKTWGQKELYTCMLLEAQNLSLTSTIFIKDLNDWALLFKELQRDTFKGELGVQLIEYMY